MLGQEVKNQCKAPNYSLNRTPKRTCLGGWYLAGLLGGKPLSSGPRYRLSLQLLGTSSPGYQALPVTGLII